MPIQRCEENARPGFKWGGHGKCFTYRLGDSGGRAKARGKAEAQGRAVHSMKLHETLRSLTGGRPKQLRQITANEGRLRQVFRRMIQNLGGMIDEAGWRQAFEARQLPPDISKRLADVLAVTQSQAIAVFRPPPELLVEQVSIKDLVARQIGELIRILTLEQLDTIREQLAILFEVGPREDILRSIGRAAGLTRRQLRAVERARLTALEQGLSIQQAADAANRTRIRLEAFRAQLIARTESVRYTNSIVQERGFQLIREGHHVTQQWVSARDTNVDAGNPNGPCVVNDNGARITVGQVFPSGHHLPPAHPGCVSGDVRVIPGGRALATTERWYDGDFLVIRIAGGHKLSCTPNHPILTQHGWVPANALVIGSQVVCTALPERPPSMFDVDYYDVPPRIQDVAEALRRSQQVPSMPVPVAAEDFHGDGEGSEVAIIWTDRLLQDRLHAALLEPRPEPSFLARSKRLLPFVRLRAEQLARHKQRLAARRIMRSSHLGRTLVRSHLSPFQPFGLRPTAYGDSGFVESEPDNVAAHSILPSQAGFGESVEVLLGNPLDRQALPNGMVHPDVMSRADRDSSIDEHAPQGIEIDTVATAERLEARSILVCLNDVLGIERIDFHGHVYNLQTSTEWYLANGVVVHNCRCVLEIWVDTPEREFANV